MTPSNIARMAAISGCRIIAVADHNSTGNCRSVLKTANEAGILAIPAMELTTSEEVHVLCLLPDLDAADAFGRYVRDRLPNIKNRPEFFGDQLYMDDDDTILGREELLLLNATSIGVNETPDLLRSFGGAAIPAHIDRSSFSIISNLGFLDREIGFSAVEISRRCDLPSFAAAHPEIIGMPYIANSDAHALPAIAEVRHMIEVGSFTARDVIKAVIEENITTIFV